MPTGCGRLQWIQFLTSRATEIPLCNYMKSFLFYQQIPYFSILFNYSRVTPGGLYHKNPNTKTLKYYKHQNINKN